MHACGVNAKRQQTLACFCNLCAYRWCILSSGHRQHAQLTTEMEAAAGAPPPKQHLFTILEEEDAPTSEKEMSTNRQVSMAD